MDFKHRGEEEEEEDEERARVVGFNGRLEGDDREFGDGQFWDLDDGGVEAGAVVK